MHFINIKVNFVIDMILFVILVTQKDIFMSSLPAQIQLLHYTLQKEKTSTAAWAVVNNYFSFLPIDQFQEDLWSLLVLALSSDQDDKLNRGCVRHDIIFFYEYTKALMEAMHLLWEQHERLQAEGPGTATIP
jgi:hypothetical protein